MSGGEIAGFIAAGAFVVLVGFAAVPLLKLGRMIDAGTRRVEQSARIIDEAVGRLAQVGDTVELANANLAHVEKVAVNVETLSANVSGLAAIFSATLGGPLVKVASFSYGVRRAAQGRQRAEVDRELKSRAKDDRALRKLEKRGEAEQARDGQAEQAPGDQAKQEAA